MEGERLQNKEPGAAPQREIPKSVHEGLIENLADKDLTTAEFDYVVDRLEKDASKEEFDFITKSEGFLADEIAKHPEVETVEGRIVQAKFHEAIGKLKREFTKGVKVALITAFSLLSQQGLAQNSGKETKKAKSHKATNKETKLGQDIGTIKIEGERGEFKNEWHPDMVKEVESYITRDGNFRSYHNPKAGWLTKNGSEKVTYAVGATKSPFKTLEEMKEKTRIPKSLGETDFFTNYVNGLGGETDSVITDPETGNRYFDYKKIDSTITGVNYEGEKHWNINRFLIQPHYIVAGVSKEEARQNALFDMYRYFLYTEHGNRDVAWEKANDFVTKEVDSIVESKFEHWFEENAKNIYDGRFTKPGVYIPMNVFDSDSSTDFVSAILVNNGRIFNGEKTGKVYTKKEIVDVLTDYNISFRKRTPEQAAAIVKAAVDEAETRAKIDLEKAQNAPLTEQKTVFKDGVTGYPAGYDSWDPVDQSQWDEHNIISFQNRFTQQDKDGHIKMFSGWRFAE